MRGKKGEGRMRRPAAALILFLVCTCSEASRAAAGAEPEAGETSPRVGISGGMGVSYVNAQDIVNLINALSVQRVPEFKSAVEFFGAVEVPVERDWIIKIEYAYLLGTYNIATDFGPGEFTFVSHMPTLMGEYVLVQEPTYNVKLGAGLGYHFGQLSTRYSTLNDDFTGSGLGSKVDFEATTAFGENVFAYLGADIRFEFIGELTNSLGGSPSSAGTVHGPTLHFFSVGAKLGFTYFF